MTIDQYMLWRFKTIDGVLDNIKSFNFEETKFSNGIKFRYEYNSEFVEITSDSVFKKDELIPFKDLTKEKLKLLGLNERTYNRHENSKIPFSGSFK